VLVFGITALKRVVGGLKAGVRSPGPKPGGRAGGLRTRDAKGECLCIRVTRPHVEHGLAKDPCAGVFGAYDLVSRVSLYCISIRTWAGSYCTVVGSELHISNITHIKSGFISGAILDDQLQVGDGVLSIWLVEEPVCAIHDLAFNGIVVTFSGRETARSRFLCRAMNQTWGIVLALN
jgi:hypothetical protein